MKALEHTYIEGNLAAVADLIEQGYIFQSGKEFLNYLSKGSEQNVDCWLPNGNVFWMKEGRFFFGHTDEKHNLILKHLTRAMVDLPQAGYFMPDLTEESWEVINHPSTLKFALDELKLVSLQEEYAEFSFKKSRYTVLSPAQKKVVSAVGYPIKRISSSDYEISISLPQSQYLLSIFCENDNAPIWRASRLSYNERYSSMHLFDRCINFPLSLPGVRQIGYAPGLEEVLECVREDVAPSLLAKIERKIKYLYHI